MRTKYGWILTKWQYYLLLFTWGLPISFCGLAVTVFFLALGYKPEQNIYGWAFRTKAAGWGGFNIGPCSIVCANAPTSTLVHEFGHSVQLAFFGCTIIPYVMIPSVIRYWYRRIKNINTPGYDEIYFEHTATWWGYKYVEATKSPLQ